MNVQEMNQSGPPMYAFAITALAILAVSAMTWTSWRAIRNIKLAYRAIVKSSENDELKLTPTSSKLVWKAPRY